MTVCTIWAIILMEAPWWMKKTCWLLIGANTVPPPNYPFSITTSSLLIPVLYWLPIPWSIARIRRLPPSWDPLILSVNKITSTPNVAFTIRFPDKPSCWIAQYWPMMASDWPETAFSMTVKPAMAKRSIMCRWMIRWIRTCLPAIIVIMTSWSRMPSPPSVPWLWIIRVATVFSCMPIHYWWIAIILTQTPFSVRCVLSTKCVCTASICRVFATLWFSIRKIPALLCIAILFFGTKGNNCWVKRLRSIWMTVRLIGPISSIRHLR